MISCMGMCVHSHTYYTTTRIIPQNPVKSKIVIMVLILYTVYKSTHPPPHPHTHTDEDMLEPSHLTAAQSKELEMVYINCPRPDPSTLNKLAQNLDLPEAHIKVGTPLHCSRSGNVVEAPMFLIIIKYQMYKFN